LVALDRGRPAPVETRRRHVAVFAEGHDDAGLTFLHDEEAAYQPQEGNDAGDDRRADAGAAHVGLEARAATTAIVVVIATAVVAALAVAEQATQALIEVTPQLIEIRRTIVRWRLAAILVSVVIVLRTATPAGIVERKLQTKSLE